MRKSLMLGAVALLAVSVAGTASSKPLNWAGTLVLELGDLPALGAAGGGVATVNGSSGAIPSHLGDLRLAASRGGIAGTDMVPITDPNQAANGIASVRVLATLQSGTVGPISGGVQSTTALTKNKLPVSGIAKVCLLSTACGLFLPLDLTQLNGAKGVGIGGLLTIGGGTLINISIEAAPWTIKTGTSVDEITTPMTINGVKKFINKTAVGFAHDPASGTTSTAQPSGVVQLITPMQVRTNLATGSNSKIGLFGRLTVHFIPEPGMLLLLGSGVAGLVLLGRQRMRK